MVLAMVGSPTVTRPFVKLDRKLMVHSGKTARNMRSLDGSAGEDGAVRSLLDVPTSWSTEIVGWYDGVGFAARVCDDGFIVRSSKGSVNVMVAILGLEEGLLVSGKQVL